MNKAAYKKNVCLYKKKGEVNKELTLSKNINRAAEGLWIYKISLLIGDVLGRLMPNLFGWMKPTIKILGAPGALSIIKPLFPLSTKVMMLSATSAIIFSTWGGEPLPALETLLRDPQAMEEINRRLVQCIADRLIDPSSTYTLDQLKILTLEDLDKAASTLAALCSEGVSFSAFAYSVAIAGLFYIDFENPWTNFARGGESPTTLFFYLISYFSEEVFDTTYISFGLWALGLGYLFLNRSVVPESPTLFAQYSYYGKELMEVEAARNLSNEAALTEMIKEIFEKNIIEEPTATFLWTEPYVNLVFNSLFNAVTYAPDAVYELLGLSGSFPYAFIWLLYLTLTLALTWKLLTKIKSSIKNAYKEHKKGFKIEIKAEEKIGRKIKNKK
jgi:hypothetical protein